jgi:hypothetical protein
MMRMIINGVLEKQGRKASYNLFYGIIIPDFCVEELRENMKKHRIADTVLT